MLLLLACSAPPPPPKPAVPGPAWPTVLAEAPAPTGYSWRTLRHDALLARLLVPDGADITETDAGIQVKHHAVTAELAVRVPGSPPPDTRGATRVERSEANVATQLEVPGGSTRIVGYTRGATCTVELSPFDRLPAAVAEAFTLCGSVRPPPLGPWGPWVKDGTQVPEGAWVAPARPSVVGDSLLGAYAPKIYAGWFVVSRSYCPSEAALAAAAEGESTVSLTELPGGWLREAKVTRDDRAYDVSARVISRQGEGCCMVDLAVLDAAPSQAEAAYAVALCDTTQPSAD